MLPTKSIARVDPEQRFEIPGFNTALTQWVNASRGFRPQTTTRFQNFLQH